MTENTISTLNQLADKVLIANATGNHDLYRDAVSNLLKAIRQLESDLRFERSHVQQLQKALMFWLPMVPDEPPEVSRRVGDDAMLLFGYDGEDEPSAEKLGWIALRRAGMSLPNTLGQSNEQVSDFLLKLIAEPSNAEIRSAARLVYGWYMGGEFPVDSPLSQPVAEEPVMAKDFTDSSDTTPRPQAGTWTLTAPDGRQWQAENPLRCVRLEQKERIPAEVALKRIFAAADDTPVLSDAKITDDLIQRIVETIPTDYFMSNPRRSASENRKVVASMVVLGVRALLSRTAPPAQEPAK